MFGFLFLLPPYFPSRFVFFSACISNRSKKSLQWNSSISTNENTKKIRLTHIWCTVSNIMGLFDHTRIFTFCKFPSNIDICYYSYSCSWINDLSSRFVGFFLTKDRSNIAPLCINIEMIFLFWFLVGFIYVAQLLSCLTQRSVGTVLEYRLFRSIGCFNRIYHNPEHLIYMKCQHTTLNIVVSKRLFY